ncbi:MAG: hypothetical protein D6735_03710 [Acidobacteria bacterium]|nr:MAG: hypothetical protein D6735_03710 [Acidobacteriota bacterium]
MNSKEQVKILVEKILQLLQNEDIFPDKKNEIDESSDDAKLKFASKSFNMLILHPSQEKFYSLRSLAQIDAEGDEICPLEPTAKICDNCSLCSCRGF